MVGAQQKPVLLSHNHTFLFGALYHFSKEHFDYFVGFQPGISLVKSNREVIAFAAPLRAAPMLTIVTGVTYYVHDYFNFFLNLRYLKGRYFTDEEISLSEIRISAGLGFHIRTKKD
jgi:hypothetical protein